MKKIGIVIPTYNREKLLKRAIDSVLNQSYLNFHICVVDDFSQDNTAQMMKQYDSFDNVHYIRFTQNSGVSKARNKALDYLLSTHIDCDYIVFLDDDDYFTSNTLKKIDTVADEGKYEWIVFNRITPDGKKITKINNYGFNKYLDMQGDAVMVMSKYLIGTHRFNESIRGREDLFYLLLAQRANMFVVDFDSTICEYLPDGMTQTRNKQNKQLIESAEKELFSKINITRDGFTFMKIDAKLKRAVYNKNYGKVFRYWKKLIILGLKER